MKESHEVLEVTTEDTQTVYQRLTPNLFSYSTTYDQSKGPRAGTSSKEVTVNGPLWNLVVGESGTGSCSVVSEGKEFEFERCPPICFIPPYSIIEMRFERLKVKFGGVVSNYPLPEDLPKKPIMFNVDSYQPPKKLSEVFELVRTRKDVLSMDRSAEPSELAVAASHYLYQHYEESIAVSDIADLLEVSHSELTKDFKRAFGITPVQFRSILRVQDSIRHLLFGGSSATEAAFKVGFEDLSRFNKNFKRIMESVPSQFTFRSGVR